MLGVDDAAVAMVLAGLASTAGQLYTNKKNLDANDYANKVNWDIARQNNATQIEMANTAHQREVADLRAAGLNPILSAGGNGASTPTLSGATMQAIQQSNAFEGLANSAKGLSRYISQEYKNKLANQVAGIDHVISSTDLLKSQTSAQELDNKLADMQFDNTKFHYNAEVGDVMAQQMENYVRYIAAVNEFGLNLKPDKDGDVFDVKIDDYGKFAKAVELEREGLRADMKTRSNSNWRANLSSFVPFVSPAAINSARNATRSTVPTYKRGYNP